MGHVIIGMDPHKRSATIEIIDSRESALERGRFGTGRDGYKAMLVGVLPAVQSEVRIGVQRVDGQLWPVPKSCSPSSWPSRKVKRARSVRSSARS